jgi:hypothetical protein
MFDLSQRPFEGSLAQGLGERMPSSPFQGVRLVHDEGGIVSEDPRFGLPIRQEEGVVDDDQVGTRKTPFSSMSPVLV